MGAFADSMRTNAGKMLAAIDTGVTDIAAELFTVTVDNSPTKPNAATAVGEFINNWKAAINGEDTVHISTRSLSGAESRASIHAVKNQKTFLSKDGYLTLTNNCSYGGNVETEGWPAPKWSGTIGPYAPVRKAFIAVAPKYK